MTKFYDSNRYYVTYFVYKNEMHIYKHTNNQYQKMDSIVLVLDGPARFRKEFKKCLITGYRDVLHGFGNATRRKRSEAVYERLDALCERWL